MTAAGLWDTRVIKPGFPDVILGPSMRQSADLHTAVLRQMMAGTAHPEGTTVDTVPHTEACTHGSFLQDVPNNFEDLLPLFLAEPDTANPGDAFPDLYSRLVLRNGHDSAERMWQAVCAQVDADAEWNEAQQKIPGMLGDIDRTVCDAINGTGRAVQGVAELNTDDLYEGAIGAEDAGDATYELGKALRHLRNACRITSQYAGEANARAAAKDKVQELTDLEKLLADLGDDDHAVYIREVAYELGLLWNHDPRPADESTEPGCGWDNPGTATVCRGCGKPRPAEAT